MSSAPRTVLGCFLMMALLGPALGQESSGTLIFDLKPFTSEIKLKKKIQRQLEAGGIEWGLDQNQLVISLVNKQYIDFDISHLTRWDTQVRLALEPGTYQVHCIGFEPKTAFSTEAWLRKSAFLNLHVTEFQIVAGRETTLQIRPVIEKHRTFFINVFQPALMTKIVDDDAAATEIAINEKNEASVDWDEYDGPLKFKTSDRDD